MYTYIVICIYNAYIRLYIYVYTHAYIHHIYERGIITVGGFGPILARTGLVRGGGRCLLHVGFHCFEVHLWGYVVAGGFCVMEGLSRWIRPSIRGPSRRSPGGLKVIGFMKGNGHS